MTRTDTEGEAACWLQQILDGTSVKISSGNWTIENSHWHGITMSVSFARALSRQLAEAQSRWVSIPTCCVTGRIAGDCDACGDCDPCILGRSAVPDVVKKLLAERGEWATKYSDAMSELAEAQGVIEQSKTLVAGCRQHEIDPRVRDDILDVLIKQPAPAPDSEDEK